METRSSKKSANIISDRAAMKSGLSPGMVEVRVHNHSEVDGALDDAVAAIREAAIRHQTGIMITRTGPGHYVIRAHPEVPFGLIRQQYQ